MNYEAAMGLAIQEARDAMENSQDIPVGAVILDSNFDLISSSHNQKELHKDVTYHAELTAIRKANLLKRDWRLQDCTLVVTLEPCLMCAGAIIASRLSRLVIGAWDEKAGACGSSWDVLRDGRALHKIEVISEIKSIECERLMKEFFGEIRTRKVN